MKSNREFDCLMVLVKLYVESGCSRGVLPEEFSADFIVCNRDHDMFVPENSVMKNHR